MARCFIAIDISPGSKNELLNAIRTLRSSGCPVKWTDPESVHMTIKFLGEITDEDIIKVKEALTCVSERVSPFYISISGIGVFPDWGHARVIWAGLDQGVGKTGYLARQVDEATSWIPSETPKKNFHPHVTLGRIKTNHKIYELRQIAAQIRLKPVLSYIDKAFMLSSKLTPKGPLYKVLGSFDLFRQDEK